MLENLKKDVFEANLDLPRLGSAGPATDSAAIYR